nr:MAG TPA: hypothetical protein [Caudoviricetes sp.]
MVKTQLQLGLFHLYCLIYARQPRHSEVEYRQA